MQLSSRCYPSPGQKNPRKKCLSAKKQQWMKRRECYCLANSCLCSRDSTNPGCSSSRMAEWWSDLPLAARISGLAREALVLSSKSITSAFVVHQIFHNLPLQQGLSACPAQLCQLSVWLAAFPVLKPNSSSLEIIAQGPGKPPHSFLTDHPKGWGTKNLSYSSSRQLNLAKESPSSFPAESAASVPHPPRALSQVAGVALCAASNLKQMITYGIDRVGR